MKHEHDGALVLLGAARVAIGALFLLRTTPILAPLHLPFLSDVSPLLGWPEQGWRIAAFGLALPAPVVAAACVLRTMAATAFALGVRARAAGVVAGVLGYVVLAQDALGIINTLHLLFASTILLASTDAVSALALRPDPPRSPRSSLWLIRAFVASIYFWGGVAKLHPDWMSGAMLARMYAEADIRGPLAPLMLGTPLACLVSAWLVPIVEIGLAPALVWSRTRRFALFAAFGLHAILELVVRPDLLGWMMVALLLSYWQSPSQRAASAGQTISP
jgi:hypothetical protein